MEAVGSDVIKDIIYHRITYILAFFVIVGALFGYIGRGYYKKDTCIQVSEPSTEPKEIRVEVSGAVRKPGVYKVMEGDRVFEAISMAEGFISDSAAYWVSKNLNLAGIIEDEQKIYVPFEWDYYENDISFESLIKSTSATQASSSAHEQDGSSSNNSDSDSEDNTDLINMNTATLDQLDQLSGIGPAYAQKIIANRPYTDLDDLKENSQVPASVIEKISSDITF